MAMNKQLLQRLNAVAGQLERNRNRSLPFFFGIAPETSLAEFTEASENRPPFPGEVELFNRGEDEFVMNRTVFVPEDFWCSEGMPALINDLNEALRPYTKTTNHHWPGSDRCGLFILGDCCRTWQRQNEANQAIIEVLRKHGIRI